MGSTVRPAAFFAIGRIASGLVRRRVKLTDGKFGAIAAVVRRAVFGCFH
jgi:hypothetical protein